MKIGEAAQKAGAPARMLRYYEQHGLIESSRSTNAYRDYSEEQVEHARHVRARAAYQCHSTAPAALTILPVSSPPALRRPSSTTRTGDGCRG
ncbi:MerR family transcriptional regulator [Saccharopolyspora sp. MS10]|uniref:MerR family transcriptional regulator n=1 Tax=Saccharopolyspora sp. MS10 TaxID=3385973 RepID=UPI0039A35A28